MVPQKKWLGSPKTSKTYQKRGRKKYFPLPYGNDQDMNGGSRFIKNRKAFLRISYYDIPLS